MDVTKPKLHPLVTIAAVSVIAFSLVGVAAMTGLIPGVFSKNNPAEPAQPAATAPTAPSTAAAEPAKPETKPAAEAAATEPAKPEVKPATAHKPAASRPHIARSNASEPPPPPRAAAAPITCATCGVIESIRVVEREGQGTGLGVVAGGVVGALLGHQVGGGTGKDLATIAGAVGGGYAGNQVEKNVRKTKAYEITVRLEDGTSQIITQQAEPGFRPGDRVKLVDGNLVAR